MLKSYFRYIRLKMHIINAPSCLYFLKCGYWKIRYMACIIFLLALLI